jgi:chromosome segregation ATPase
MTNTLDKLGGSLINAVLGGLILWVGQTTVRHEGVLAGLDEKLAGVDQQFAEVDKRHESVKKWLENVVSSMKDSNRDQFTLKEGDKLVSQVRHAEQFASELERRLVERVAALETRLASLEVQHRGSQEVTALQMQVTQLRGELAQAAAIAQEVQYQTGARVARGTPVFLPPVSNTR